MRAETRISKKLKRMRTWRKKMRRMNRVRKMEGGHETVNEW